MTKKQSKIEEIVESEREISDSEIDELRKKYPNWLNLSVQKTKEFMKKRAIPSLKYNIEKNFSGFVLCLYDSEQMSGKLKVIPKVSSYLRIKELGQSFYLDKPAIILDGKPLYIVLNHFPISLSLKMLDGNERIMDKDGNFVILEKGFTSDELDVKIHSMYVNTVWKKSIIGLSTVIQWILSLIVAVLTTVLVMKFIPDGNSVNNTTEIITTATTTTTTIGAMLKWMIF